MQSLAIAGRCRMKTASAKPSATGWRGWVIPALLVLLWQLVSGLGPEYSYAFVPVPQIVDSAAELLRSGELARHVLASVLTASQSLLTGGSLGLLLALLMLYWRWLDFLISPLFHSIRQVPTLGLIPLIGLWFGNTETAKLVVVSMATFEVMLLNTYEGLNTVPQRYQELARSLVLSKFQLFRYVLVPAAVPSMTTGVLHAVAFSWLATVGVELLFTVGPGISVIMERAQMAERMDIVIVCISIIGLLGYLMNACCQRLSRKFLSWR
jgi:sulfonate transport system permease protein